MSGKLNVATLTKLAHLLVEAEPQKPKVLIEEPKEEEEP